MAQVGGRVDLCLASDVKLSDGPGGCTDRWEGRRDSPVPCQAQEPSASSQRAPIRGERGQRGSWLSERGQVRGRLPSTLANDTGCRIAEGVVSYELTRLAGDAPCPFRALASSTAPPSSSSSVSTTSNSATACTAHETAYDDPETPLEDQNQSSATGAPRFLEDTEDLLRSFVLAGCADRWR